MSARFFSMSVFSRIQQPVKWGRHYWWLSALIWLMVVAPAQAALEMRVAIEEEASKVKVGSSTNAIVRNGAGQVLGELAGMNGFSAELRGKFVAINRWQAGQIWIEPTGDGYIYINDRWYRGRTLLVPTGKGITAVNYVDLEKYLYSVLGAEMDGGWPLEALKAQAVAARSYALHERGAGTNGLYDVGDNQGWQVYKGVETESPGTYAAVDTTAGQVLTHNGEIILAAFHSSSGGHTENVEDVWEQPLPYLRGVPDDDRGTPGYEWTKTFSRAELSRLISGVGNVVSMTPERTTPTGRIITMKVVGDAGTRSMSGDALRDTLGLRSSRFKVNPQAGQQPSKGNSKPVPTAFVIQGYGFGHGIGLSQWGAYNMARRGVPYQSILAHYYQGATLATIQVE
ncbi:SpoIID/LytB domain-containing protein [Microcoleus sp. FACHB-672]|uniref:SpoIID/LytB domain-containing protein n=1 Tax=Microcoleus sp. FACHB-672 TaxID=2692825 RepID=UPI001689B21E|nr:SpoIID/LytB domain-containing protein [Microcoleus sp. FACHB-672]MBD2041769.1 SpoIID/LytB domain-containing protein [Microcoleus sp. FACHB-672]